MSEDFRMHPVAQAIAPVLEHHDRGRFESSRYRSGRTTGAPCVPASMRSADRFIDAAGQGDKETAAHLRRAEIDIAVDLMGFTGTARSTIMARRIAPVQVNFLGFAGTMGAPYMDYLIADAVAISEFAKPHFAEKIVHLLDSFLPAELRALPHAPSRAEASLPETGFVFAAFNNPYKIAPDMFRRWLGLLARAKGSVLWLGKANDTAMHHLTREAEAAGIAPERLVFAPFVASAEAHLARLSLADLFLDTWPQNAHRTAADRSGQACPSSPAQAEPLRGASRPACCTRSDCRNW